VSADGQPSVGARASFACAVFALAVAAIYVLERVGAPDRLVTAVGPLAGVIGVAALGVLTRARTLLDFLVARRSVPPFYAGLALAAPIGGFALAFAGVTTNPTLLPWRGVVAGLALAVLVAAPHWRAAQASAMADVFATRFPAVFTRVAFAAVLTVCGWAMAASGLGYASLTLRDSMGLSADAAAGLAAAALVISLAPGGMRSLVWTDAASAGAGFATMGLLVALSAKSGADNAARLEAASHSLSHLPGAPWLQEIAAAAAAASLFAFVSPALAVATPRAARRAGVTALLVLGLGGVAAAALGDLTTRSPSDSALAALVACLPALALARAGLYAASRALGLDLVRAPKRLSVLGSRRMASVRFAVLVGAGVAAAVSRLSPHPSAPLYLAMALWLAFAAPSLALSALPGRGAIPAGAALIASLVAALAGRLIGFGDPGYGPDLLVGALAAGMAGLAVGLAAYALTPPGAVAPRLADPYVELPGEAASPPV
jgi:Na+/proline symporter